MTPAQARTLAAVEGELARLARYDDESLVHAAWIRQRYDGGLAASYAPARAEAARTAWHEAGHAVAALTVGARFSSVSIRAGGSSAGRVYRIQGSTADGRGDLAFVVDAAGQVAERLRDWTLPARDAEVAVFLAQWHRDGGDARRFRAAITSRFAGNEAAAWHYSVQVLTPLRPRIARLARGLLVHPRHLPYPVAAAIAGPADYSVPVTWDELLAYCLAKPGAWQDEPWDGDVVVKVGPKIFAFLGPGDRVPPAVGLKCGASRDAADEWLARYPGTATVMPYIGRSGWNTLQADAIPDDELTEAIDASYEAILRKLPKKDRPAS